MSDVDVTYFRRRAEEERQRAADAADACARKVHERIAAEYERIATGTKEPTLKVVAG